MCILFIHISNNDESSPYSLILVANRDEFFDRPAQAMAPWVEDPNIIGGLDLQSGCTGGAWLALSKTYRKLGVLLNLPTEKKPDVQSRGSIVTNFVKRNAPTEEYVEELRKKANEFNDFVFVTVDFRNSPTVHTYCNATQELDAWNETCLGFGNHLPKQPLKKVEAGKAILREICQKYNNLSMKQELVEELVNFLKSNKRYLPDNQLLQRGTPFYKELSSIFVSIPAHKYGTRTHTLLLMTKSGEVNLIEISLKSPIDVNNLVWEKNEFNFSL